MAIPNHITKAAIVGVVEFVLLACNLCTDQCRLVATAAAS